MTPELFYFY